MLKKHFNKRRLRNVIMQYMINQSDYYRKLMSSFFFLLQGTMEAKFILIAVIIPIIASQGINKGKNSMLKTVNFF